MPVTFSLLTTGTLGDDGPYVSDSISPVAGTPVFLGFNTVGDLTAAGEEAVSIVGVCPAWTLVRKVQGTPGVSYWMYVYRGIANSTGTVTITWGQELFSSSWIIIGSDANPTSPVVQSNSATNTTGTSASVTLSAFASANNGTLSFAAMDTQQGGTARVTAGSGFTELAEQLAYFDYSQFQAQGRADADTTADCSWTFNGPWSIIALEVAEAGAGGGRTTKNTRAHGLGMELGMNLWGQI